MNRKPININNDDAQYETFKSCHHKYIKKNDVCKDSLSYPVGSTVAVQHEDGELWMQGVIEKVNNSNHYGRSYII